MIKSIDDLKCKFVRVSNTDVYDLFIEKCKEFGITWRNGTFIDDCRSIDDSGNMQFASFEFHDGEGYTELTLEDFIWKPQVGEKCIAEYLGGTHVIEISCIDREYFMCLGDNDIEMVFPIKHTTLKPFDHNRKPVIDKAIEVCQGKEHPIDVIEALYDAGMLSCKAE